MSIDIDSFMSKNFPDINYKISPPPKFTFDIIYEDSIWTAIRNSHKNTKRVVYRVGDVLDNLKKYEIHDISVQPNNLGILFGKTNKEVAITYTQLDEL